MSYDRFFVMLSRVPRIAPLWNKDTRSLNVERFENALGVMSSGEVQMAKFFASVWYHNNGDYGFDLVDAVASIDAEEIELIIEWMMNPFYP